MISSMSVRKCESLTNIDHCSVCNKLINEDEWCNFAGVCSNCFLYVLPFNHLQPDDFNVAIHQLKTDVVIDIDHLKHLIFDPFTCNERFAGNADLDPDQNFYSKNHCNSEYLLSDQLSEQVIRDKDQNLFSSLHFNARSLF